MEYNGINTIKEELAIIDERLNNGEVISNDEIKNTLLLMGIDSKKSEKAKIFNVTGLNVRHNCHEVLQFGYKTICREITYTLDDNATAENFTIIVGQYITLKTLEEYLRHERVLEDQQLNALSSRTIKTIDKSAKIFKKVNNIGNR